LPHFVAGGISVKKPSLLFKTVAIANALLITAAFVGCPGRKDPSIPTIAPQLPTIAPQLEVPHLPKETPKDQAPPFVTIAPYGGNFQHLLPDQTPTPASRDSANEKRSP
jgi:hypothetical protein